MAVASSPRRPPSGRRWATPSSAWGIGLGLVMVLIAGACGGASEESRSRSGPEFVRPFSEVQAAPVVFEADPSDPGRAIARVTTTVPMICAIVWGVDERFGRFNNSLSMNGTGIEDHDVVLPGVEAGVTYRFVLQGSTADGALYRSDVGSFQIAPVAVADRSERGENLARGAAVVDVSSEFSAAFAADRAVDGDTSTEWATRDDGDRGYIVIDLGALRPLGGVEFITRSMADGSSVTQTFTVTVDDGEPQGPFPAATVAQPRVAALTATGRRLRFDVEGSTGGNVGAVEISVYGR